jgi:hypothetical protein
VTINVTTDPISYSAQDAQTNSVPANPLKVRPGDSVTWTVTTTSAHPYRATVLFPNNTPFWDAHYNIPVYAFEGASMAIGGTTGSTSGRYEYCVAVFDDNTHQTYADDPKIIVGSGQQDAKAEIVDAEGELREVRNKIESIEKQLQKAIQELK